MSVQVNGYYGSNGEWTDDSRGFVFRAQKSERQLIGGSYQTIYGCFYCAVLGGYWDSQGSSAMPYSSDSEVYGTAGSIYFNANGTQKGTITAGTKTYYTVSTSSNTGGGVSGGGNFPSGTSVTITATPNSNYLVRELNGTTYNYTGTGTPGAKSVAITVTTDKTVSVTFARYYTLRYYSMSSSSGGTYVNDGVPKIINTDYKLKTISELKITKAGYGFQGWATSAANARNSIIAYADGATINLSGTPSRPTSLYAVWGQVTITFDMGSASNPVYDGPASVDSSGEITLPALPSHSNENITCTGWLINGELYEGGAKYNLESSVTAIAQWDGIVIQIRAVLEGQLISAGTFSVVSVSGGERETGEERGAFDYVGKGGSFRIECALGNETPDILYTADSPSVNIAVLDGVVQTCNFPLTKKPLYWVKGSRNPATGQTALFEVVSPLPDGTIPAPAGVEEQEYQAWVQGRDIVVGYVGNTSGEPDRYILESAYLDDENGNYTGISFSRAGGTIVDNSFTIQNLQHNYYVRGVAAERTYSASAQVDSASAVSSMSVSVSAGAVTKNTVVEFSATNLATGYSFAGWFDSNGNPAPDSTVEEEGVSATYRYTDAVYKVAIAADTLLVAKAKIAVALALYNPDSGTITVNGEEYEPGTPFDVVLGETFAYTLVSAENKYFRGWYASGYPEVKSRYAVSQSGTWPVPAAGFTAVAIVVDEAPVEPGEELAVSIAYASGCNATMGEIFIDGGTDLSVIRAYTEDEDRVPTTIVVLSAVAKNGYVFAGWYENDAGQGDAVKTPEYEILLTEDVTLYAKFVQNDHYICEWEGSDTPKLMTWRSKTYAASKPFNPSACRVDALGYPPGGIPGTDAVKVLEFTVDMFSAPNAAATETTTLDNIENQDARRLPVMRMERYMQIEVKANVEVDALLVGTSMGGIAV